MELYYMDKNNLIPIVEPTVDAYYACNHDESWFRVRLVGIEGKIG